VAIVLSAAAGLAILTAGGGATVEATTPTIIIQPH
jgi:hypothetical protein